MGNRGYVFLVESLGDIAPACSVLSIHEARDSLRGGYPNLVGLPHKGDRILVPDRFARVLIQSSDSGFRVGSVRSELIMDRAEPRHESLTRFRVIPASNKPHEFRH